MPWEMLSTIATDRCYRVWEENEGIRGAVRAFGLQGLMLMPHV